MKGHFLSRGALMFAAALAISAGALSSQEVTHAQTAEATIEPQSVTYGEVEGESLMLDVYQPATSATPLPAVVLIHGGGGSFGSRSDLSAYAQALAAAGYVTFNIDYRLIATDGTTTKNMWPAQLEDSQLAVRWVRANAATYHVDPDRICSLGHSSGGQLAALLGERDTPTDSNLTLGTYSSRVSCVVDIAGSVDPLEPMTGAGQGLNLPLMGGSASDQPERYQDASPLAHVDANTAPFLIFHSADDDIVPVNESRLMVDALHKADVEVVYAEIPHVHHLDWPGMWNVVGPETLAFLSRHLSTLAP